MFPAKLNRGRGKLIFGKHTTGGCRDIGIYQSQIQGAGFLYPRRYCLRPKPLSQGYGVFMLFHTFPRLPRQRRWPPLLRGGFLNRPSVSSKPHIRFMFCTAWPEAPLSRLSIAEIIIIVFWSALTLTPISQKLVP